MSSLELYLAFALGVALGVVVHWLYPILVEALTPESERRTLPWVYYDGAGRTGVEAKRRAWTRK